MIGAATPFGNIWMDLPILNRTPSYASEIIIGFAEVDRFVSKSIFLLIP